MTVKLATSNSHVVPPVLQSTAAKLILVVLLIGIAAGLRIWPLGGLGNGLTWVTFYPMVMASALIGGLTTGTFAVALTVALTWGWGPTGVPFSDNPAYWLGVAVFTFNGLLVASMGEGMRRSRKRLAEARDQAEIANSTKSTFLAHMSHEFRTPLNAVLGFSRLLSRNESIPAEERAKLELINRSGQHLLTMINDVLDFSKIEAGKETLQLEAFKLRGALEDATEIARVRAMAKDISYVVELDDVADCVVESDRAKLCQVLINLLGNAVKFTDEGGVALRARTIGASGDEFELQVEVEDSGPGIPDSQLAEIFEPFVQTGASQAMTKGTGLGLAISKTFVEMLGGTLDVETKLGKGSRFRLILPLRISAIEAVDKRSEFELLPTALAPGQTDWRILIVDDDETNRLLLGSQLGRVGLETREATNGAEGVQIFKEWSPHFIWMDIRMPVMDGYEATRTIRKLPHGKDVEIVAITASVFHDQLNNIIEAGCDEIVHKPYREHEIFDTLSRRLDMKFVYEAEQSGLEPGPAQLDYSAEVALIDPELAERMRKVVRSCDEKSLQLLINELPEEQADFAQRLRSFLREFDWDLLEKTLEIKP